jgi:hypothetical protein
MSIESYSLMGSALTKVRSSRLLAAALAVAVLFAVAILWFYYRPTIEFVR